MQSSILSIFDQLAKKESGVSMYIIYTAVKFMSHFFLQTFYRNQERASKYGKIGKYDKYLYFTAIKEVSIIRDISNRIT